MLKKLFLLLSLLLFCCNFANTAQNDFYTYFKQLKTTVNQAWEAPSLSKLYVSDINFTILKDGSINDLKVVKSSGSKTIDNKAIAAVMSADKKFPSPSDYNSQSIDVTIELSTAHSKNVYKKVSKKSYKKTKKVLECKNVKVKKVILDENYKGVSNFQDKMIQPVLNLDIQNAYRK